MLRNLACFEIATFGVYHEAGPLHRIVLRFDASVRQYLEEHTFHHSQSLKIQPDGSLLVGFELASFREISSWILGFGPKAEVLEPAELREEVTNCLKKSLEMYSSKNPERKNA